MPGIIIIPQVYPPETHSTAVMAQELAEHLARIGWDVTVCAGLPHHPQGNLVAGWRNLKFYRMKENGVKVVRFPHFVHPSRISAVRALGYASQSLSQCVSAMSSEKADAVFVIGPPLIGPTLAAAAAARFRARLVNVIFDIYPDIAIETGIVSNPLIKSAARLAERMQYGLSDLIIVPSDGFKQTLIEKSVDERKIAVVPVWIDADEIQPLSRDNAWRRAQGISSETFVVMYAGTIGRVSGASVVIEAAKRLADKKEILFLFVGEGEEKQHMQRAAKDASLSNVRFLPFQPRARLSEVLSTADLCLVTLAPGRGRTSVPSKVQAYMAAGRPVIASADVDSDTAHAVRTHDMGMAVPPGDGLLLCEAIVTIQKDTALQSRFGKSARKEFLTTYAKDRVLKKLEVALRQVVRNKSYVGMPLGGTPQPLDRPQEMAPTTSHESEMKIAPMKSAHAKEVASLHIRSFEGFFLASLGEEVPAKYYESIVDFGQIGFIATSDDRLIGFVTGIESTFGFYEKLLLKRPVSFAVSLLSRVAADPFIAFRIARRLKERRSASARRRAQSNCVELTSIAVSESRRGSGAAHRLMDAFKKESLKRGFTRIYLETDVSENERALRFYQKEGFVLNGEYRTSEGRKMAEFTFDLSFR